MIWNERAVEFSRYILINDVNLLCPCFDRRHIVHIILTICCGALANFKRATYDLYHPTYLKQADALPLKFQDFILFSFLSESRFQVNESP